MKKISITLAALALVAFTSCKNDTKKVEDVVEETVEETVEEVVEKVKTKKPEKVLSLRLSPKSDSRVDGKLQFSQTDGVVTMEASITGLTPGTHAIHIHEKADCSSADGKSTGGHWNPTFQPHAAWGAEGGFHLGDIGNFEANEDGQGSVTFSTDLWCIGCGDENKDIVGKAIIVHEGTDDLTSQPSGAAGSRVSCAAIIERVDTVPN